MPKSFRKQRMMEEFPQLREKGLSFEEIAQACNVSSSLIYKSLQEIADNYGCERETLLYVPHPNYVRKEAINTGAETTQVSLEQIREKMAVLLQEMQSMKVKAEIVMEDA